MPPQARATDRRSIFVRNLLIAFAALLLGAGLYLASQFQSNRVGLAALVERSTPWAEAQTNGRPTLIEFYADWCSSCRAMAPVLNDIENTFQAQVNFVMLNVDNPKWLPELTEYQVNGIPHFVFLSATGDRLVEAIGEQPREVLEANLLALTYQTPPVTPSTPGRTSTMSQNLEGNQNLGRKGDSTQPLSHSVSAVGDS